MKIAIKDVKLSPYQVRDLEGDAELEALAESIREHGQLQPVKLRPILDAEPCSVHGWEALWGDMDWVDAHVACLGCGALTHAWIEADAEGQPIFECVFGHRRLKAADLAGLESIEAIVAETTDEDAQIQTLIENTQRKDLEPIERAKAYQNLQEQTGWTIAEMARRIREPEQTISDYLLLLEETKDIQQMVVGDRHHLAATAVRGTLSPRHILKVRKPVPDQEQRAAILRKAAAEELNYDQTRKLAERYRDAETPEAKERVLEVPAKRQEDEEVIDKYLEDSRKEFHQAVQKPEQEPMTVSDYIFGLQTATERVAKFLTAGREVEVWYEASWPIAKGFITDLAEDMGKFLEEARNARG